MNLWLPVVIVSAILLIMAGEAVLAAHNERVLRAQGAREPAGDVYATMRWVYPGGFVLMGGEALLTGLPGPDVLGAGLALFGFAKALKLWAISALGPRWTYRVLVLPSASLVTSGPYRFLRHPNYVGVVGELVGAALMLGALVTGPLATVGFGLLMWQRTQVEDRALGRQ